MLIKSVGPTDSERGIKGSAENSTFDGDRYDDKEIEMFCLGLSGAINCILLGEGG